MNAVKFGNLEVGPIPRVVGTLSSFDSLTRFGTIADNACDIAEVRLDVIGTDKDWLPECKRIEANGTPVILTIRSAAEGGKSAITDKERKNLYSLGLPHVSAIDVELNSGLADSDLYIQVKTSGKAIIISFHDFAKTPPLVDLLAMVEKAAPRASVVKVSTFINSPSDIEVLNTLLETGPQAPLCVIGMGPLGTSTRISFPSSGSCLTYGYLDVSAAPGQLPAATLVNELHARSRP